MTDFNKIKQLVKERDEFLAKHPELQPLQDEIDEVLKKSNSKHNRNAILQEMMLTKLHEIAKVWKGEK